MRCHWCHVRASLCPSVVKEMNTLAHYNLSKIIEFHNRHFEMKCLEWQTVYECLFFSSSVNFVLISIWLSCCDIIRFSNVTRYHLSRSPVPWYFCHEYTCIYRGFNWCRFMALSSWWIWIDWKTVWVPTYYCIYLRYASYNSCYCDRHNIWEIEN